MINSYMICQRCGGENRIKKSYIDKGLVEEAETICKLCGHQNYWAHDVWSEKPEKTFKFALKCFAFKLLQIFKVELKAFAIKSSFRFLKKRG